MAKRKIGDVSKKGEDGSQAQIDTTDDDAGGFYSYVADVADVEDELHGGPSRSGKDHSSNSSDDEDIDEEYVLSSADGAHWHTPSVQKGWSHERAENDRTHEGPPTAFGRAFAKIMNKRLCQSDITEKSGPILGDRKRLLLQKFDKKDAEKKEKLSSTEDTRQVRERGHILPLTYTDGKERVLIRMATKGVVRLFNAVSKAQRIQPGTNIKSEKGVNAVLKQTKATFLTELRKPDLEPNFEAIREIASHGELQPDWPALKPSFMLGRSFGHAAGWDRSLTNADSTGDI